MTLIWSIFTPQAWAEPQSKHRLRASRCHAEQDFIAPYTWMAEQMERSLKTPRPSSDTMPMWAWYQWLGTERRKPDLRAVRYWHPKGEHAIRVECRVEADRVLLSDFHLWHYVLNYWYLPKTLADDDAFDKKLEAAGLSTYRCTHENPLPDADYRHEVEASWQRIFDLEWVDLDLTYAPETKAIQATLWELLLEDVVDAMEFVGAKLQRATSKS